VTAEVSTRRSLMRLGATSPVAHPAKCRIPRSATVSPSQEIMGTRTQNLDLLISASRAVM
jgi:hypothetical protein